jgi:hypothetical protein
VSVTLKKKKKVRKSESAPGTVFLENIFAEAKFLYGVFTFFEAFWTAHLSTFRAN